MTWDAAGTSKLPLPEPQSLPWQTSKSAAHAGNLGEGSRNECPQIGVSIQMRFQLHTDDTHQAFRSWLHTGHPEVEMCFFAQTSHLWFHPKPSHPRPHPSRGNTVSTLVLEKRGAELPSPQCLHTLSTPLLLSCAGHGTHRIQHTVSVLCELGPLEFFLPLFTVPRPKAGIHTVSAWTMSVEEGATPASRDSEDPSSSPDSATAWVALTSGSLRCEPQGLALWELFKLEI